MKKILISILTTGLFVLLFTWNSNAAALNFSDLAFDTNFTIGELSYKAASTKGAWGKSTGSFFDYNASILPLPSSNYYNNLSVVSGNDDPNADVPTGQGQPDLYNDDSKIKIFAVEGNLSDETDQTIVVTGQGQPDLYNDDSKIKMFAVEGNLSDEADQTSGVTGQGQPDLYNAKIKIFAVKGNLSDEADQTIVVTGEGEYDDIPYAGVHIGATDDMEKNNNNPMPVPEPASLFLLGSGILGLAGFKLRKKNNKQR